MKINFYVSLLFFLLFTFLRGQDIHWSQPSGALLYQNPSFMGINGKYSANLNFKDQWNAANGTYRTYGFSGDYRLSAESKQTQVYGGLVIYKDATADRLYQTNAIALNLACLVPIDEKSKFGAGISYGFAQNSLNKDKFSWGNQFDGQAYNSTLSTGENDNKLNNSYTDINAGVSYIYQEKNGTVSNNSPDMFLAGYSVSHLNKPDISLTGNEYKLPVKHTLMLSCIASMRENRAIKPTLLIQIQGKMLNIVGGNLWRFEIGQISKYTGIRKASVFSAGLLYRFKDALIPTIELEKSNLAIGMSYDVTLSKLSGGTKYRGGLEIYLRLKAVDSYLYKDKNKPVKPDNNDGQPKY